MYTKVSSFGINGIDSYLIVVEVVVQRGLPGFEIVGLPDAAVRESRDRVRSAMKNLGYPTINGKVTVNLAPASTKKVGSIYDLPIIIALLNAAGYEDYNLDGIALAGEIGLAGEVRGINGVLPMVLDAQKLGLEKVIIPVQNSAEASVAKDVQVLTAASVREVIDYLNQKSSLNKPEYKPEEDIDGNSILDFTDVKGQSEAKRAMEVAAAGGHNLLLVGPPGTGKSMLAKRLSGILPTMSIDEAIETTKIYSIAGQLLSGNGLITKRPFRSPHHSSSSVALVGGGGDPKPGDISLANNGVLFLDEMPEFNKASLEVLRQPLEDKQVVISRVRQRITYPANVMLVGAMNPCPCGFFGAEGKTCVCTPNKISKYLGKISGPMLDRIDIQIEVQPVNYQQMTAAKSTGSTLEIKSRVDAARELQSERYKNVGITSNSQITAALLQEYCKLEPAAENILKSAFDRLGLSARGYNRILKVARTIADLEHSEIINSMHISEAIQYRSLDRKYWGN